MLRWLHKHRGTGSSGHNRPLKLQNAVSRKRLGQIQELKKQQVVRETTFFASPKSLP